MIVLPDVSFEKLVKFKDRTFQIIHVLNLYLKNETSGNKHVIDTYFKLLLSDGNIYMTIDIPPYLLNLLYYGLNIKSYKDTGTEIINSYLESISVSLDVPKPEEQKKHKLSEVLTEKEYKQNISIDYRDFKEEIKNQSCVCLEKDGKLFIFPDPVISAFFYFRDEKFTRDFLSINLRNQYHTVDVKHKKIHMKSGFKHDNAYFLYLYHTNQIAKTVYDKTARQIYIAIHSEKKKYNFPFKTNFPFACEDVEFSMQAIKISENKFLVSKIEYVNLEKIVGGQIILQITEKQEIKEIKRQFIPLQDSLSTGVIKENIKPDKKEYYVILKPIEIDAKTLDQNTENAENTRLNEDKALRFAGKEFVKKDAYLEHDNKERKVIPVELPSDEKKDLTFKELNSELQNNGKNIKIDINTRNVQKGFSLKDFESNFSIVLKRLNIKNEDIYKQYGKINTGFIKKPKLNLIHPISKKPRNYLSVSFFYQKKYITVIELDHSYITDKLFTLIIYTNSERCTNINKKLINDIIHRYIDERYRLEGIKKYLDRKGIKLYCKRHPQGENKEKIQDWITAFVEVIESKLSYFP